MITLEVFWVINVYLNVCIRITTYLGFIQRFHCLVIQAYYKVVMLTLAQKSRPVFLFACFRLVIKWRLTRKWLAYGHPLNSWQRRELKW